MAEWPALYMLTECRISGGNECFLLAFFGGSGKPIVICSFLCQYYVTESLPQSDTAYLRNKHFNSALGPVQKLKRKKKIRLFRALKMKPREVGFHIEHICSR